MVHHWESISTFFFILLKSTGIWCRCNLPTDHGGPLCGYTKWWVWESRRGVGFLCGLRLPVKTSMLWYGNHSPLIERQAPVSAWILRRWWDRHGISTIFNCDLFVSMTVQLKIVEIPCLLKCWKKFKIVEKCFHDCMFLVVFGVSFDVSLRSRTCTLCT